MDPRIIQSKLDTILARAVTHRWPIAAWQGRTADHLDNEAYRFDGEWVPLGGASTWHAGKTVFLRVQAEIPEGVAAGDLFLQFEIHDLEGLLSIDGQPYAGIDANHTRVPLSRSGAVELQVEFLSVPRSFSDPTDKEGWWGGAAFVHIDRSVLDAYYDLSFTWEASRAAPDDLRRQMLDAALEAALLIVDLTAPGDTFRAQVAEARGLLRERIAAIPADPGRGRIVLTGHSHIDTAWLWPLRETVRKVGRTFSTACRLLERYPHYYFSCSQPQLYAYAKRYYPALYQEIGRWVRAGRWVCSGGMWVEADCNATSGESLIRQILHGLRFFREEFGARPRTCWLPDAFGFPASLPGILAGCGLSYFYTNKLHWQSRDPVQNNLFWWEGIDGSRVLAHVPKLPGYYNGFPRPEQINLAWRDYQQKAVHPQLLFPYGYGDGGGGPTEAMLEYAARAEGSPAVPACSQGGEEDYFDAVIAAQPALPVWVGELYLETHRGTLTSQGTIKQANRCNELLLREAEIHGSLAQMMGLPMDLSPLHDAWENLLLLQFHDILPGSSIGQVYREAAVDHGRIADTARGLRDEAMSGVTQHLGIPGDIVVWNGLSWPRRDVARAAIPAPVGAVELLQPDGRPIAAQVIARHDDQAEIVFAPEDVPSVGYMALTVRPLAAPQEHSLRAYTDALENRYFRLVLDGEGQITGLFDKRQQREVLPAGEAANRLQLFQDGPEREAAWNVHATFDKREYAWDPGTEIEVLERGPVRAAVRIRKHYRDTTLEQDIILYDRVPRIDFATRVDWQARQVMLKAAFPVQVRAQRATYEVQFGAMERTTHYNTSWDQERFEVCGQRWVDLSEPGYGVSLLNDSKYGHDIKGHTLRLTLLRGPEWPDPNADRGQHAFTYALLPHAGDWCQADTVRRAYELNAPLVCRPGSGAGSGPASQSFLQVEGPAILETLKPAEDGDGWIARLYEPHGSRGRVRLQAPRALRRAEACNLVEEPLREIPVSGSEVEIPIGPFEIATLRLVPA